jgi:hypothetical protein
MSSKEWCRPYASLSDGQRARADAAALLAAAVRDGGKGGGERGRVLIDEFTSLLDRRTAAKLSRGMCAYIQRKDVRGVVLATCHKDVVRFLAKGSECLDWAKILKCRYVVTLYKKCTRALTFENFARCSGLTLAPCIRARR